VNFWIVKVHRVLDFQGREMSVFRNGAGIFLIIQLAECKAGFFFFPQVHS